MPDQPEISGRRVAGHRDRLGIKQWQLAEYLGIGVSTLQGIERNRANPSLATLVKLAGALTDYRLDLITHQGLTDEEEYNDARHGNPTGPQGRVVGSMDVRPTTGVPLDVQRVRDEVRGVVRTLRSPLRPDPRGA